MTPQERIKADAEVYANGIGDVYRKYAARYGYIAGATAEHDRAQVLVDFIQEIIDFPPAQSKAAMMEWVDKYRNEGRDLLEQWKSGKGKDEKRETCGICKERPVEDGLTVCNDCYENFDGDRRGFWKSDVYQ